MGLLRLLNSAALVPICPETVQNPTEVESLLPQKVCLDVKSRHFIHILGGSKLSTSKKHEFLRSLRSEIRHRNIKNIMTKNKPKKRVARVKNPNYPSSDKSLVIN